MVTTKKIDIKYTKKEMKKKYLFYSKNVYFTSTIHKKDDEEIEGQRKLGHIENKQQNDRNLLSVIISNVNGLNCPIKK